MQNRLCRYYLRFNPWFYTWTSVWNTSCISDRWCPCKNMTYPDGIWKENNAYSYNMTTMVTYQTSKCDIRLRIPLLLQRPPPPLHIYTMSVIVVRAHLFLNLPGFHKNLKINKTLITKYLSNQFDKIFLFLIYKYFHIFS